jgi:hypothetical protein
VPRALGLAAPLLAAGTDELTAGVDDALAAVFELPPAHAATTRASATHPMAMPKPFVPLVTRMPPISRYLPMLRPMLTRLAPLPTRGHPDRQ